MVESDVETPMPFVDEDCQSSNPGSAVASVVILIAAAVSFAVV